MDFVCGLQVDGSRQVNSSCDSAMQDDDDETVKSLSHEGHSYDGTAARVVLRGYSEIGLL